MLPWAGIEFLQHSPLTWPHSIDQMILNQVHKVQTKKTQPLWGKMRVSLYMNYFTIIVIIMIYNEYTAWPLSKDFHIIITWFSQPWKRTKQLLWCPFSRKKSDNSQWPTQGHEVYMWQIWDLNLVVLTSNSVFCLLNYPTWIRAEKICFDVSG